jgi:hypothetical protein
LALENTMQRFEITTIKRSQIAKASYNPRFISNHAKETLRENLRTHGLVEPLCWNKQTGTLVGGHQRITIMDEEMGYREADNRNDYEMQVSAIDVDAKTEARLNVVLNNTRQQGEWDIAALQDLVLDFEFDPIEDLGFTEFDVEIMFGESPVFGETRAAGEAKDSVSDIKETRSNADKTFEETNDTQFMAVLVFPSRAKKEEFMRLISVAEFETYVDGVKAVHALGGVI